MILCGPNVTVSLCFEPKIKRQLLLSFEICQFQFKIQMYPNDDDVSVLNVLGAQGITVKAPKIWSDLVLIEVSSTTFKD